MKLQGVLKERAGGIRMVLFDVDGVLTDGGLYYGPAGVEWKRFHAQDGYGIRLAREAGIDVGIVSGRVAAAVTARARELQIDECHQGVVDKLAVLEDLRARRGFVPAQLAFMGDDLFDLPLLRAVGLAAAPADARPEVRRAVHLVTVARGGEGAAREFLDMLIGLRNRAPAGGPRGRKNRVSPRQGKRRRTIP